MKEYMISDEMMKSETNKAHIMQITKMVLSSLCDLMRADWRSKYRNTKEIRVNVTANVTERKNFSVIRMVRFG